MGIPGTECRNTPRAMTRSTGRENSIVAEPHGHLALLVH